MEVTQYSIYWVELDPTRGSEISKTRPCVVISPDDMNHYIKTVIIAPLTHTIKPYPSRVICNVDGQNGSIMLDQLRTVDKLRVVKLMGKLSSGEIAKVKFVINQMLC